MVLVIRAVFEKLSISIVLPVVSKVEREQPEASMEAYYNIRGYFDFAIMLGSGILFVLAPDIITFLFDDRYADAGWMLRLLSMSLIGMSFLQGQRYLVSRGLLRENLAVTFCYAVVANAALPLFFYWQGFPAAIVAFSLSWCAPVLLLFVILHRYQMLSLTKELRFLPLLGVGLGIGVGIQQLLTWFPHA
jgi:hypothetical protein